MSDVSLTFLGATRTVTGSRFLVSTGASTVLIDAGLFQGDSDERQLNWKPFPVDPATIDAIVLTHAHLDHCGYLPLLVKRGFRGKIYATHYTAKLAEVTMRDSGRIQEEDAKFAERKGYSSHKPALPLYTEEDAVQAVRRFAQIHELEQIDVFDAAFAHLAREHATIAQDVRAQWHPRGERRDDDAEHEHGERGVNQHARPAQPLHEPWPRPGAEAARRRAHVGGAGEFMLRRHADQTGRAAEFEHHPIAAVGAQSAIDAFVLRAVADVDAGRANLLANAAIDAIAGAPGRGSGSA